MIKALLLLAALIVPAFGQSVSPPVTQGRFLGMNDLDPSLSIGDEAQSALNVETSLNGSALLKRFGYARTASLSVSTSPATGVYAFVDPNGNKQQIVCSDHYCAKSTNNSAFAVFLSTAGGTCMPTRWQFAQIGGYLYGVNDCHDAPFKYDGTTFTSPLTMPLGSIIEATKDRLVISGVSANPSNVYYSQSGTPTNFTTGINSADPYIDPVGAQGDQVRAMKYALGRFFIFKTNSITSCVLGDQYTSKCFPVSNTVGTSDPLSVIEVPGSMTTQGMTSGALLFRGSDLNFWQLDQTGLNVISRKITNLVASQTNGSNQSNTQNNQAAWQAGTQTPSSSWNTTTLSGSIFPSSVTVGDNTTVAFSSGVTFTNIDTATVSNQIQLTSTTVQDNFSTGGTAGRLAWTTSGHSWIIGSSGSPYTVQTNDGSPSTDLSSELDTSSITLNAGSWKFSHYYHGTGFYVCSYAAGAGAFGTTGTCFSFRFMVKANGDYYELKLNEVFNGSYTPNKTLILTKNISSVSTVILSTGIAVYENTNNYFEVQRDANGVMALVYNSVFSTGTASGDTAITSSVGTHLLASTYGFGGNVDAWNSFSNIYAYQYAPSGTFVSREFDTAFSTPTWGPFSSTFTVAANNSDYQTDFYTYVSTSPNNDMWDAKIASSDTVRMTNAKKRYAKYEVDMYATVSTKTPNVQAVALNAATTGQFVTQCIQPGSNITAWGQLSCAQTLAGGGSDVFYTTSAATCAGLPSVPPLDGTGVLEKGWAAQTNNATVSIATNAAVYVGFRSLLTSATDQAQVNACTIYWANGVPAAPSWGAYDPVKNAAYWTTAINNATTANRVLKYDMNLGEWYPFGLNATALYRDQNSNAIYFGDSSAGFWNKYGGVTSDNGAAINAFWQGRDIGSPAGPFVDNSFNRISIAAKNQVTGSMGLTYNLSNNTNNTYSVSLSTTAGVVYIHGNYNVLKASPFQFINIQLGNNSTTPFEVDALSLDMSSFGWKAQNP